MTMMIEVCKHTQMLLLPIGRVDQKLKERYMKGWNCKLGGLFHVTFLITTFSSENLHGVATMTIGMIYIPLQKHLHI